jgi:hypothetical protein
VRAPDVERVDPLSLHFDRLNPRLMTHSSNEREILRTLWRDFAVNEVAISIAANGFWDYEPLIATREDGRAVVVEGNRRLAAVRLLLNEDERKAVGATDLPAITDQRRLELQQIPVRFESRESVWQYVGFKHVNGPQAWQSYSKAQYVAWVHNSIGVSLNEIAETIGDTHATVTRLYRALMVLEQSERRNVWSREDKFKNHFSFSHLSTGINSYSAIQKYLGFDGPPPEQPDPVAEEYLGNLGELMVWLYGSKSEGIAPLVQSQNPDLRKLDRALSTPNSAAAIRSGMPLDVAVDVAKGDSAKLRENLVGARRLLQDARGKVLTGFDGNRDLIDTADEILVLAEAIQDEMRSLLRRPRRRKTVS